jgi:hypothetical protein
MNCGITLVSESVLDYVNAVNFAGFLAERFFCSFYLSFYKRAFP